jgi:hypothetical protein
MAKKAARKQKQIVWTGNRPPMKHSDFYIGCEFLTGSGRWRCTDVGKRIIAAIKLDHDDDPRWYNGLLTRSSKMFLTSSALKAASERLSGARTMPAGGRK